MNPAFFFSLSLFICHPFAVGQQQASDHPLLVKEDERGHFCGVPVQGKKRPYIYRNWLQETSASYILWRWTLSFILAFTFRNWRGQTMLPKESSERNDLLSLLPLTLFILTFFKGTCGLRVMIVAQFFLIGFPCRNNDICVQLQIRRFPSANQKLLLWMEILGFD